MIRELIVINILLVLTSSINAIYNVRTSSVKVNLNKCCPMGTYVGKRKICSNYNTTLDVSKIKIYDKDINPTRKSFEDLFTLIPHKFVNKTYAKKFLDALVLDYNVFVIESGEIILELPNAYNRWTHISPDSYCIDLDFRKKGSEPRFWAIIPSDERVSSNNNRFLTNATRVSCFFMLLVLLVYILLPELQNLYGLILMAYVFSLFMAFLLLVVFQIPELFITDACIVFSSGVYYFFLATFCWMSVMSYNMWLTFRSRFQVSSHQRRREKYSKFLIYCIYAWGVPLLLTIFLVVVNKYKNDMRNLPWFVTPRIPENGCFLQGGVKLLYFYVPMLIIIICNWIFFLMTVFHIWQSNQGTAVVSSDAAGNKQAHRDQNQILMIYLKLSLVMGLSWLLEVISFVYPGPDGKMWFISDTYNCLIGLAMFLVFVCKKKILKKLYKRCEVRKITCWSSKRTERSKTDSSQDDIALRWKVSSQPNGGNDP